MRGKWWMVRIGWTGWNENHDTYEATRDFWWQAYLQHYVVNSKEVWIDGKCW